MNMDRFRKRKNDEEKRALESVLGDFEKDHSGGPITETKAFVRADVVNANKSIGSDNKGQLYKPTSNVFTSLASAAPKKPMTGPAALEEAKKLATERAQRMMEEAARKQMLKGPAVVVPAQNKLRPPRPGQKKEIKPKVSNLELFKQELQAAQEERDKRRGLREHLVKTVGLDAAAVDRVAPSLDNPYLRGTGGEYDHDTETTNLYVCNLPMDIQMEELLDTFGSYGPLASARVLYPRSEAERVRDHLCGFIGFMCRTDVERAMAGLQGFVIRGDPIKFSLAKPVPIPPTPFYVPQPLQQYMFPDAPTGLPFNAKPRATDLKAYIDRYEKLPDVGSLPESKAAEEDFRKMLKNAVVRVVIPTDSSLLAVIHRTIEFVVRFGATFEKLLLDEEAHNEIYQFLWNYHHPAHIYYRWKLYSILQGEKLYEWRTERFKMYEDGSWWEPPPLPGTLFRSMPRSLYHTAFSVQKPEDEIRRDVEEKVTRKRRRSTSADVREREKRRRARLRTKDRDRFENLLRTLTPEKHNIARAMVFCVEHAMAAKELVECIVESLCIDETPLHKKIARLYLVADILANCAIRGVRDVFQFRKYFEEGFTKIFVALGRVLKGVTARLKAEQYKQRVMACFQAWEITAVYSKEMLIHHQNVFLGLVEVNESESSSSSSSSEDEADVKRKKRGTDDEDLDGMPLEQMQQDKDKNMSIYDDDDDMKGDKKPPVGGGGFKSGGWAEVDPNAPPPVRSKWDEEEDERNPFSSKWESVPKKEPEETAPFVYTGEGSSPTAAASSSSHQQNLSKWDDDDGNSSGEIESPEPPKESADSKKSEAEKLRDKLLTELKGKVDALRRQLIEDRDPDCEVIVRRFEKEQKEKITKQVQELEKEAKKKKDSKKDKKDKEKDRSDDRRSGADRDRSDRGDRDRRRSNSRSRRRSRSRDRDRVDRDRKSERGSERGSERDRRRSRSPDRERRRSPDRRRR